MLQLSTTLLAFDDQQEAILPGKMSFFDALYIDFELEEQSNFHRYRLTVHPKRNVQIKRLTLRFAYAYQPDELIFCNGYQSSSESREYSISEHTAGLHSLAPKRLALSGDYQIPLLSQRKEGLHSWTYSYIRQKEQFLFIASLLEQTAFTLIRHHPQEQELILEKDCEGLRLTHSFPALDVLIGKGKEQQLFDEYFKLLNIPKPVQALVSSWTSLQNSSSKITEAAVLQSLNTLPKQISPLSGHPRQQADFFHIGEGYQHHLGDWLRINDGFPSGMAAMARQIRERGLRPSIWLAPFICEQGSDIFEKHKDWLLKDQQGQLVKAGYNSRWKGWFYALDFYQPLFQQYLSGLLHTVLEKWGFEMVHLDYLYAACIIGRANKTRAQVMADALHFLRKTVDEKLILAGSVPLGSAFGQVDYCQTGASQLYSWEHRWLKMARYRERAAALPALRSAIGRWHLNGRAFGSAAPTIGWKSDSNVLHAEQQYSFLLIESLLNQLQFNSPEVAIQEAERGADWQDVQHWRGCNLEAVMNPESDRYILLFEKGDEPFVAFCNLTKAPASMFYQKLSVELLPFESLVLQRK